MVGCIVAVKAITFLDADAELQFGAIACFSVFVRSGEDRKPDGDTGDRPQQPRRPRRPDYRTQREHVIQFHGDVVHDIDRAPKTEVEPDPRPFFDDDINDVGRGP
jgi:hypothetical protein